MAMNAAKKTEMEKKVVMSLLGLFGVTLVMGPLKSVVRFKSAAPVPGRAVSAGPPPAAPVTPPKTVVTKAAPAIAQASDPVAGEPAYAAQELRDPMKSLLPHAPPVSTVQAAAPKSPVRAAVMPALQVRGILWGGAQAQAIINDNVYRVGDSVSGLTILAIDRNSVTVDFDGSPTVISSSTAPKTGSQQARRR